MQRVLLGHKRKHASYFAVVVGINLCITENHVAANFDVAFGSRTARQDVEQARLSGTYNELGLGFCIIADQNLSERILPYLKRP